MKRGLALTQIFILLFSIIAFNFILNVGIVSAGKPISTKAVLSETKSKKVPATATVPVSTAAASGVAKFGTAPKIIEHTLKEGETLSLIVNGKSTPINKIYKVDGIWKLRKGSEYYAIESTDSIATLDKGLNDGVLTAAQTVTEKTGSSSTSRFFELQGGGGWDAIVSGAQWALVTYGIVKMTGPMLGLDDDEVDATAVAAAMGFGVGKSLYTLISEGGKWYNPTKWYSANAGSWATAGGVATAAIVFYMMYEKEETETKTYTCSPWDAPVGGNNCEKCNNQKGLPCSEYQCKSLGQSCQLLNPGTSDEKCTWVNRHDVNPPVIKPWNNALLHGYVYAPDSAISPPDKGVKVLNNIASGCAPAFTPLTFGITTNEPAQCKMSVLRENNITSMPFDFGGTNAYLYNHTQTMSLPSNDSLQAANLTIQNGGNYEVYVRCQDANGNANTANFVFKYCVDTGPDTTAPLIVTTSLLNNMPIAYNQTSVAIDVYTNEPASCKWDHLDTNYVSMLNNMTCASSVLNVNTQMLYKCSTTLTGLKNKVNNDFYFKCEDMAGNENTQSYPFTLIGTQPLVISSASPNSTTLQDATDVVQVTLRAETSAGHNNGESICHYNDGTGEVMFFNTSSYNHSQSLWLSPGTYNYDIRCVDLGGNTDQVSIDFVVQSDVTSPLVVRVYHEGTYLKLVTNEDAECVYDTTDCTYAIADGIQLSSADDIHHYTDWDTQTNFYIKCKDSFGNEPLPNKCNIIAKPSEI